MYYKLYFKYGVMNSSKTANLLMVCHNYESQGKNVLLIKPKLDNRFGEDIIKSRIGLQKKANLIVSEKDPIITNHLFNWEYYSVCLVDEVNFLSIEQINELRELTKWFPVICYGLKTDYRSELFPASKRLLEIADQIEEIKTICNYCDKKAIINMKHIDGKVIKKGSDIPDLGGEDKYLGVCWKCWENTYEL
jgi:thymidine kinase